MNSGSISREHSGSKSGTFGFRDNEVVSSALSVSAQLGTFGSLTWIEKQRRLLNSSTLELEPMLYIKIHLCYVNANGDIEEFTSAKHNATKISEQEMQKLVQDYKKPSYTFVEMSSFIAQKFDDAEFKTYSMVSSIEFPPALFIYHDINCLLFLYREKNTSGNKTTKRVRFAPRELRSRAVDPMKSTRRKDIK